MDTAKSYAVTFLSFGASLIGLSFLTNGWSKVSLITLGVAFTITAILFVTSQVQTAMARNGYGAHR